MLKFQRLDYIPRQNQHPSPGNLKRNIKIPQPASHHLPTTQLYRNKDSSLFRRTIFRVDSHTIRTRSSEITKSIPIRSLGYGTFGRNILSTRGKYDNGKLTLQNGSHSQPISATEMKKPSFRGLFTTQPIKNQTERRLPKISAPPSDRQHQISSNQMSRRPLHLS